MKSGASKQSACEIIGISLRTLNRWHDKTIDGRTTRVQRPANKLTWEVEQEIFNLVNSQEFKDLPPSQIVPILADRGIYLASESTIYRLLRREKQLSHRQATRPPRHQAPKTFVATGPNQVWTWDITYLKTNVLGRHYYLYLICDIYSRKIVGWEIYEHEKADFSADLVRKSYLKESINGGPLVLHSDNGAPMKGATMLATLQRLGVIPSFSRPSVSNDNPFSEALFRTLKYRPLYPKKPFESLEEARLWVADFTNWYNSRHRHSGIKFVTPNQRHSGEDKQILAKRAQVYQSARDKFPERWSNQLRNWRPVGPVQLNPRNDNKPSFQEVA